MVSEDGATSCLGILLGACCRSFNDNYVDSLTLLSLFHTQIYRDDPSTEGAMYVGMILGSDKTTVSVGTGNVKYHPLYISFGNIHNMVQRGHRNTVIPIGFLAIPKG